MRVKDLMVGIALDMAADNRYGYSNDWPNNRFGDDATPFDGDCGAFCSFCLNEALKKIGINETRYYEPQGGWSIYNEEYLLKYCNKYSYNGTRNKVGDILISGGHTVMVTAVDPDYITHAAGNYDGRSGDSSGREIRTQALYRGDWHYIYRLKEEYNKEIDEEDYEMNYAEKQILEASCKDVTIKKGSKMTSLVAFVQEYLQYFKYYEGAIDGDWGDMTNEAFKAWQKARGLKVDGICGQVSWNAIRNS